MEQVCVGSQVSDEAWGPSVASQQGHQQNCFSPAHSLFTLVRAQYFWNFCFSVMLSWSQQLVSSKLVGEQTCWKAHMCITQHAVWWYQSCSNTKLRRAVCREHHCFDPFPKLWPKFPAEFYTWVPRGHPEPRSGPGPGRWAGPRQLLMPQAAGLGAQERHIPSLLLHECFFKQNCLMVRDFSNFSDHW